MTAHEFCTYFDSGYVSRALVLHDSLLATGAAFRLNALCLDEASYEVVKGLRRPTLRPIGLSELETHDAELVKAKPTRSLYEYYFTVGPSFLQMMLERDGFERVTYLDADMCFYSSPAPLHEEAAQASVVIVGHRFPDRLKHLEETGRFNVAWVGFHGTEDGRECLSWWRERCLEWCFDRVEGDRYADQRYLDEFPLRCGGVHELRHPGADVAPWNVAGPPLEWTGTQFTVMGQPLIFFHFQGLKMVGRHLVDPNLAAYGNRATPALRRLYRDYVARLRGVDVGMSMSAPRRPSVGTVTQHGRRILRGLRYGELIAVPPRWRTGS